MLNRKITILILFLIICCAPIAKADDKIPFNVPATKGTVSLDGLLNEKLWEDALQFDLAYEIFPGDNLPAAAKTTVFITYDKEFLYVGFKAFDPDPKAIRANYRDRDNLYGDDYIGIEFDTFNNERTSFSFFSNPLGIQEDTSNNEMGYSSGGNWDAIWESAGQLTNYGYSVEMKIPFSVIRFPQTDGKMTWGVFASRSYPRNFVYGFRNTRLEKGSNCELCQSAKLIGFEGVAPGQNIEITPTYSALRLGSRDPFPEGNMKVQESTADFGVSGHWGITPNSTFSAAINPDFSQIEADSLELDINRQFAIYYDEKRPFFLEGEEFFHGLHTRTIADPEWGAKYTHREGSNSFGFVTAKDRITNLIFPGAEGSRQTSLNRENTASSFRYTRDIWNRSSIGVALTDRRAGEYQNNLLGLDGTFRMGRNDSIGFDLRHTRTMYGDDLASEFGQPLGDFSGNALSVNYAHNTRGWDHGVSYEEFDNNYRSDMNHISQVGYRTLAINAGPTFYGDKDDFLKRVLWGMDYFLKERKDGQMLARAFITSLIMTMPKQSLFFAGLHRNTSWFLGKRFDLTGGHLLGAVKLLPNLKITGGFNFGDAIDYLGVRAGETMRLSERTQIDIGKHLSLEARYVYTKFTVDGQRLYMTNTVESKLLWQINANTYLRSTLQFADIRRNQDMYSITVNPISRRFFSQILFSYKMNPRTVLYLGYNSNSRGHQDLGLTTDSQMVFFKVGYAFLM